MKLITYSKVGYNAPSGANWAYSIFKIDMIDSKKVYCFSETVKAKFGSEADFVNKVSKELKEDIIQVQGVHTSTGFQKITGVSRMKDIDSDEVFHIIKDFLSTI